MGGVTVYGENIEVPEAAESSSDSEELTGELGEVTVSLSKNKLRKSRKYVKRREQRREKRPLEKSKRKEINEEKGVFVYRRFRGNDEKLMAKEKLRLGLKLGPKVVIDCRYEERMSTKEQKRFAQQIRRAYSSNRASENPLHLYLTSLEELSPFYKICCEQNSGFEEYVIEKSRKSVEELFWDVKEEIVYLSPDAGGELEEFCPDRIYVIGGIVDETGRKGVSRKLAQGMNVSSARIPIDKYFCKGERGTFKKVLTVNQVVDIILEWHRSKDWVQAIRAGLPTRTGFLPVRVDFG